MAETPFKITINCSRCDGTGKLPIGPQGGDVDCPDCEGDGKLGEGNIEGAEQIADLTSKVEDVLDKCKDILEKLDD